MSGKRLRAVASAGLVTGALLGMAGTFATSAVLRGLAWGVDGIAIIVGSALLVVHHVREGNDQLAAGFLVFDLFDLWEGRDKASLRIATWDDHPNAAGNRLIAERLFALIQRHRAELKLGGALAAPRVTIR